MTNEITAKLKAYGDNKLDIYDSDNVVIHEKVQNIVEKEENVNQHFLLFSKCFQKRDIKFLKTSIW